MRGFELSERFFRGVGLPEIERRLPQCVRRLAAGVGSAGSQAHKNDDDISRDHGWGPEFSVWLAQGDYQKYGSRLQEILDTLPAEYDGFHWENPPERTCSVWEVGSYAENTVGFPEPPPSLRDWLRIPEPYLFELTPNRLYHDELGIVSARFRAFSRYPEDVWRHRLAACLSWCWEWGRKHLFRAEARGDHVTAFNYWTKFAEYATKVGFLINRRYAPYHKWLWKEFEKLEGAPVEVCRLLREGYERVRGRRELVERVEAVYTDELEKLGFSPADRTDSHRTPYPDNRLYRIALAVRRRVVDPDVKNLHLREEVVHPATRAGWTWLR